MGGPGEKAEGCRTLLSRSVGCLAMANLVSSQDVPGCGGMARGHFGHLHLRPRPQEHLEGGERTCISPRSLNTSGSALGWQDTGTVNWYRAGRSLLPPLTPSCISVGSF